MSENNDFNWYKGLSLRKQTQYALKLQELVKDKMNMEQPHENDEAYWTDPYQLLHSLVEESEK